MANERKMAEEGRPCVRKFVRVRRVKPSNSIQDPAFKVFNGAATRPCSFFIHARATEGLLGEMLRPAAAAEEEEEEESSRSKSSHPILGGLMEKMVDAATSVEEEELSSTASSPCMETRSVGVGRSKGSNSIQESASGIEFQWLRANEDVQLVKRKMVKVTRM